jgi:hypothetical protein
MTLIGCFFEPSRDGYRATTRSIWHRWALESDT